MTTSFKSCSTNRAEASVFKSGVKDGSRMLFILAGGTDKVPFVDVNDILSDESHIYDDEKEILLPPFVLMDIITETLWSPDEIAMDLSSDTRNPYTMEEIPRFNYEEHNMSDEELKLIIELQNKHSKTQEELLKLERLLNKMYTYIMSRCSTIKTLYMGNPIIIEGKISADDHETVAILGCNIPGVDKPGTVFTLSDVYVSTLDPKNPSTLDRLTIVPELKRKLGEQPTISDLEIKSTEIPPAIGTRKIQGTLKAEDTVNADIRETLNGREQ